MHLIVFKKNANQDQNCSFELIYFNVQRCTHTDFHMCRSYIVIGLHEEPDNFYREKRSVTLVTGNLFTFFGGFISRRFGDYANINM